MLNKTVDQAKSKLSKVPDFISKYRYPIGGTLIVLVFGFTIYRIGSLSGPGMNQDRYNQGLVEQKKVIFNEEAIERINNLDERSVNVGENIDETRNNPF